VPDTQLLPFTFHKKYFVVPDAQEADAALEVIAVLEVDFVILNAGGALIVVVPLTVAEAALSRPDAAA
jgi:hypothetical protein